MDLLDTKRRDVFAFNPQHAQARLIGVQQPAVRRGRADQVGGGLNDGNEPALRFLNTFAFGYFHGQRGGSLIDQLRQMSVQHAPLQRHGNLVADAMQHLQFVLAEQVIAIAGQIHHPQGLAAPEPQRYGGMATQALRIALSPGEALALDDVDVRGALHIQQLTLTGAVAFECVRPAERGR